MPGTLFVVATPIGNLEDVSARALRVLREVSVIAAEDTRRTAHLIARYGIPTPTTSLHEHNEAEKTPALLTRLLRGEQIALVSDAGTPTVSDPGQRLIRTAIDSGVRVEPIPGPSAILAALAVSGMPADTFIFLGFPPTRANDRTEWFQSVKAAGRTVVFFEAPSRIRATLERLQIELGDCHSLVARELTKAHEELVNGPISVALERLREPRGEFTVVLDCGRLPKNDHREGLSDHDLAVEYSKLAASGELTRRRIITALSRKYGRPANQVYAAVERAKNRSRDQK